MAQQILTPDSATFVRGTRVAVGRRSTGEAAARYLEKSQVLAVWNRTAGTTRIMSGFSRTESVMQDSREGR